MNVDHVVVNREEVEISIEKLKMYKKDHNLIAEDIKNSLYHLANCYDSNNSKNIVEVTEILNNNLRQENIIYDDDINYISKSLVSFSKIVVQTEKIFEKLGEDNGR